MKKTTLLIAVFFISLSMNPQELIKKIPLKEGSVSNIEYNNLKIGTLLQVYDEKSAVHLNGDMYLKVDNDGEPIAEFYIDKSTKVYATKIYKNYFLTFKYEDNNKYLIIEPARFGKAFALSSNGYSTIANKNEGIEIEITDYIHEWGNDASPEDGNKNSFDDVQYTLKVKANDVVKSFSFYSSEIKDDFTIDFGNYSILILSDLYKDTSCLIEMIVSKK